MEAAPHHHMNLALGSTYVANRWQNQRISSGTRPADKHPGLRLTVLLPSPALEGPSLHLYASHLCGLVF